MTKAELNAIHYNSDKLESYNAIYNMSVGVRGVGKTYNFKRRSLRRFLKRGKQFVWVRRYKPEIQELKDKGKFLEDIIQNGEFKGCEFTFDRDKFLVSGKVAGYLIPLSTSYQKKSTSYPLVDSIIYDEFVIDTGIGSNYMTNETDAFDNLFETVARMRDDVNAFLLANCIAMNNPFFYQYNLFPDLTRTKPYQLANDGLVCLETVFKEAFAQEKSKTRFARLKAGTNFGEYAFNNQYLRDNDTFVEPKSKDAVMTLMLKYNDRWWAFWSDIRGKGLMYMTSAKDMDFPRKYCLQMDDHAPNILLIKSIGDSYDIKLIVLAFKFNYMRFDSMQTKSHFYDLIKLFLR